jgi:hypothetical protein
MYRKTRLLLGGEALLCCDIAGKRFPCVDERGSYGEHDRAYTGVDEWARSTLHSKKQANSSCTDSLCTSARGAIFDLANSATWQDQSFYNLGVDARFGGSAYAQYGLDDITFGSTGMTLFNTIIGSINATEYWLGMFGLGIIPGNFKTVTSLPAISGLVEKASLYPIPSHSYGYTAGARYRKLKCYLHDCECLAYTIQNRKVCPTR